MPAACTNSYTPHNNAETGTVTLTLWIRKLRLTEVDLSKISKLKGLKARVRSRQSASFSVCKLLYLPGAR